MLHIDQRLTRKFEKYVYANGCVCVINYLRLEMDFKQSNPRLYRITKDYKVCLNRRTSETSGVYLNSSSIICLVERAICCYAND